MRGALELQEEAEHVFWARRTFGHIELDDPRLVERTVCLAALLAAKPGSSIPQACGDWGSTKAAYRYFANESVSLSVLHKSVRTAAVANCRGLSAVYAVQDSTSFNFSALKDTVGLGPIAERRGRNGGTPARGIHLHSTLALSPGGLPLGLLNLDFWARSDTPPTKRAKRKSRPISEKESYRWLTSARMAHQAMATLDTRPRLVHVCDREGDIHEFFAEIVALGDDAVIRCAQNRAVLGAYDRTYAAVHAQPILAATTVEVRRTSKYPARTAYVHVRATTLTLKGSSFNRRHRPLTLTLIEVWEPTPPSEEQRLVWRLWTTLPVTNPAEALEVIRIYTLRWRIEDVHLAVKSGCNAENLQLSTCERLYKALTLYMAIAVRIVSLKDLVRQKPDAPCTIAFSTLEWRALWAHKYRRQCPAHIPVPTLREAVMWLGQLGGHLGRKSDGLPGVRTLWRGLRDLQLLVEAHHFRDG